MIYLPQEPWSWPYNFCINKNTNRDGGVADMLHFVTKPQTSNIFERKKSNGFPTYS